MTRPRPRPSPGRIARSGLSVVPDLEPRPRACDDETLVLQGTIYAFPIWEISAKTGMIILYEADPATGQLILDRAGHPTMVAQVPSPELARADAKPRVVFDYVGQTIRELDVREAEHIAEKCWADLIAGRPVVVEQGQWNKRTRDGKEIDAIARLQPRFNKEYNEHNPRRIEIWRQVELRHKRDDALHRGRWLPLEQRSAAALEAAERAVVGAGLDGNEPRYPLTVLGDALLWLWRHRGAGPDWLRRAAMIPLAWAALTMVLGAGLNLGLGWSSHLAAVAAAAVSIVLMALVAGGRHKKRRRRRR